MPIHTVATAVKELVWKYASFGGMADWESINTLPGGLPDQVMGGAIMAKAIGDERRGMLHHSGGAFSRAA